MSSLLDCRAGRSIHPSASFDLVKIKSASAAPRSLSAFHSRGFRNTNTLVINNHHSPIKALLQSRGSDSTRWLEASSSTALPPPFFLRDLQCSNDGFLVCNCISIRDCQSEMVDRLFRKKLVPKLSLTWNFWPAASMPHVVVAG